MFPQPQYGDAEKDGAPAHTASIAAPFLQKKCSNSPDLNPIEHLWGAMKSIIKQHYNEVKNSEALAIVQEVWDAFPQESIDRLVLSFTARL
jgi:hypothetical protein